MQIRPRPGLEIDGFTLGECLHKGGFATLWDVAHPDHAPPLIMKVPTILDGDDGPAIVGFETEQMILPRLSGPHVPRFVAAGDFAHLPYLVTERLAGGTLLDTVRAAPVAWPQAVDLTIHICQATHDLHLQGVSHLDLKPENLMTRPDGTIVAIDFGLARHDRLPDLLAEEFRIPMGTFPYIAPEQYLGQRDDPRSDLFAIGAMLYELITGRKPFGSPEKLRSVRKRLWRDPPPPRALAPDTPEWLQEIILRALEVDPARRYQSAAQMAFDLEHPDQVALTERGRKRQRDSGLTVFRRWRAARRNKAHTAPRSAADQIDRAPILLVAVDLSPQMEPLSAQLRRAVQRMLVIAPDARIACVNVIKTPRIGIEQMRDDHGNHVHVSRLVGLRAWAAELGLPEERISFSVLDGPEPATEILAHAVHNRVDHILMGARGHSTTRRYLGSVSARVVAEAPCSVTVIRIPDRNGTAEAFPSASDQA